MAQTSRSSPAIGGAVPTQCVETRYTYEDAEIHYQRILIAERVDSDWGSRRYVASGGHYSVARGDAVVVAYRDGAFLIGLRNLGFPIIGPGMTVTHHPEVAGLKRIRESGETNGGKVESKQKDCMHPLSHQAPVYEGPHHPETVTGIKCFQCGSRL